MTSAAEDQPTCERCACHSIEDDVAPVLGVRWDGGPRQCEGDVLCSRCRGELLQALADEYPAPGKGQPAAFLVAQQRDARAVDRNTAIKLACCIGRLMLAAALKKEARADVHGAVCRRASGFQAVCLSPLHKRYTRARRKVRGSALRTDNESCA